MFSFLRRGRRGRGNNVEPRATSRVAGSPQASRNRVVARPYDDGDRDSEDEFYDERQPLQPRSSKAGRYTGHNDAQASEEDEENNETSGDDSHPQDDLPDEDDDGRHEASPLLPIFSAAHLDCLPVYNITHAIRLAVVQKCETTLSWDQLRSPQVSQFLVKPIQSQIRANHFNRATLYALIANCLQFNKEAQQKPAILGISKTRALICELLAMRLLKEFASDELIDALSYDFDPLQNMKTTPPQIALAESDVRGPRNARLATSSPPIQVKGVRVSTIEVAIRAQAKRFLAHPVVVQHLEAIWAGSIVFHSAADSLHRRWPSNPEHLYQNGHRYGAIQEDFPGISPADAVLSRKARHLRPNRRPSAPGSILRRTVTLYNPRDASLFKLSRLRVPRYRQLFSTLSFATLLGLFLAVLAQRNLHITSLEVVFWLWSIGYMLDEVVGFTEQGFSLYILSFWNIFDLGILVLFVAYFCLRMYGVIVVDEGQQRIASYAYDILASGAVLLFPRLFSVLDHYRYFSQLLIAFRMMAVDLMAVLVLIVILCSGFFAAFTLSFTDEQTDANTVAYTLFQIIMGFTPAVWDRWHSLNLPGKTIMVVFLIVCHFVIVTVLITVLTNSFMAIVRNAEEEHQFLLAINTISMVKSDALFSYVAPANIIGWMLSPLRFMLPFRQYLKTNRTVIKITHFPLLLGIFTYERLVLSMYAQEPSDLIEASTNSRNGMVALTRRKSQDVFTLSKRVREPSIVGTHKDRALDEVFRRPYMGDTIQTTARTISADRRNSSNAVAKWMQLAENEGGASPPLEQPRSVVERLEHRRVPFRRAATTDRLLRPTQSRDFSMTRSLASEPDINSTLALRRPGKISEESDELLHSPSYIPPATGARDDEEITPLDSDNVGPGIGESISIMQQSDVPRKESDADDYFQTPRPRQQPFPQISPGNNFGTSRFNSPYPAHRRQVKSKHRKKISSNTILYAPQGQATGVSAPSSIKSGKVHPPFATRNPNDVVSITDMNNQVSSARRAPIENTIRTRPILPPRHRTQPDLSPIGGLTFVENAARGNRRRDPSFNARALDLASDLGDNKWVTSGAVPGFSFDAGVSASLNEQLYRERERDRHQRRRTGEVDDENGMVNRILLARMNRLEESFREVLGEIRAASRRESEGETSSSVFRIAPVPSSSTSLNKRGGGGNRARRSARAAVLKENLPPSSAFARASDDRLKGKDIDLEPRDSGSGPVTTDQDSTRPSTAFHLSGPKGSDEES